MLSNDCMLSDECKFECEVTNWPKLLSVLQLNNHLGWHYHDCTSQKDTLKMESEIQGNGRVNYIGYYFMKEMHSFIFLNTQQPLTCDSHHFNNKLIFF